MGSPGKTADCVDLQTYLWGILPQALALETSRDAASATHHGDDPGSLVNLIENQDAIAPPPETAPLDEPRTVAAPGVTAVESGPGDTILAEIEASGLLDGSASSGLALLGVDLEDGSLDPLFSGDYFAESLPGPTLPFAGPPGSAAGQGAGNTRYLGDLIS